MSRTIARPRREYSHVHRQARKPRRRAPPLYSDDTGEGHALSLVVYLGRQQLLDAADFIGQLSNYVATTATSGSAAGTPSVHWVTLLGDIASDLGPKTVVDVAIPVHQWWRKEIAKAPRRAVISLYDRSGRPFSSEDRIQERMRRLMRDLGHVDADGQLLYTFCGRRNNACCYLLELGLSDPAVGAALGMTPETVRHYGRRAPAYMIARGAAEKITGWGKIMRLVGNQPSPNKRSSQIKLVTPTGIEPVFQP